MTMTKRQNVRAIIIRDNKLLVIKRNKFGDVYYTLLGGGVEPGEDHITALRREVREEASMNFGDAQHVFTEDSGLRFGVQYIYLCEDVGGEPHLSADSEEAAQNLRGRNTYEPLWLPLSELSSVSFRSSSVRDALQEALRGRFPDVPVELAWKD